MGPQCPPEEACVLKVLSLGHGTIRRWQNFWRGGASWEEGRSLGMCPWRGYWKILFSSSLSLSLFAGCHEGDSPLSHTPIMIYMIYSITTGPNNGVKRLALKWCTEINLASL